MSVLTDGIIYVIYYLYYLELSICYLHSLALDFTENFNLDETLSHSNIQSLVSVFDYITYIIINHRLI